MIQALRAELRKLLTVRSTYVITSLCLILVVLSAFFIAGYLSTSSSIDPNLAAAEIITVVEFLGLIIAVIALLLMTHEYRYTTIVYTLTEARHRSTVLLAKYLIITVFSVALIVLAVLLTPFLLELGLQAKGLSYASQNIPYASLLGHAAFYSWGYSMFALIIAVIIRNQVGAVATFFLFQSLGEGVLSLLLKHNAKYLPFHALAASLHAVPARREIGLAASLSQPHAMLLVLLYIAVGSVIAWLLFVKRDAN